MRNFHRKDNDNLGRLLYEDFGNLDDDFEDELDGGFEDDFGDDGFDEPEADVSVMEIEAPGPVEMTTDEVNEVLVSDLKKLAEYADRLQEMSKTAEFDDWMVAKITKASDYVSDVWHRLDAKADFANTGFEQGDDFEVNF